MNEDITGILRDNNIPFVEFFENNNTLIYVEGNDKLLKVLQENEWLPKDAIELPHKITHKMETRTIFVCPLSYKYADVLFCMIKNF